MRTAWSVALPSVILAACASGHAATVAAPSTAPGASGDLEAEAGVSSEPSPRGSTLSSAQGGGSEADAGKPRVHEPGRGQEDIRAIVVAHRDEARACYEKSLATHPGIEGDLVVRWSIDPKGTVSQVSCDSTRSQIVEPSLVSCIGEILMKIQFAPSQRGFETRAFYPFNFHPRHGPRTGLP
jgi:hypothetical protein